MDTFTMINTNDVLGFNFSEINNPDEFNDNGLDIHSNLPKMKAFRGFQVDEGELSEDMTEEGIKAPPQYGTLEDCNRARWVGIDPTDAASEWLAAHGGPTVESPADPLDTTDRRTSATFYGAHVKRPAPVVTGEMQTFNSSFEEDWGENLKGVLLIALKRALRCARDSEDPPAPYSAYERGTVGGVIGTVNRFVSIWDPSQVLEEITSRGLLPDPVLEGIIKRHG